MAESKNNFLKSKMNKDMDNRLVPAGEYRDAVNLNTSRSEGSNVGTVENILGNDLTYLTKLYNGDPYVITIGVLPDEKNNRIFWFVTNFTDTTSVQRAPYSGSLCAILMHIEGEQTQPVVLVQGHFLNFSKNHLITGVNLVENLLFWTDGFNQPRRINVEAILANERTYTIEEQLSIIRYSPYLAPQVVNLYKRSGAEINDYLLDKFVRISYRYKFIDNEYSIIAPFTQILFVPKDNGKLNAPTNTKIIHTGLASSMINDLSSVKISVKMPSIDMPSYYHVKGIEILLKSSDSTAIKVIDYIDMTRADFGIAYTTYVNNTPTSTFIYTYLGSKPYKTLPDNQYTRIYDNVPVKASAQEIIGSRVVYGNYTQNIKLPKLNYIIQLINKPEAVAGDALISTTGIPATGTTTGKYPQHSIKQKRPYSVGVVLSDIFGRQSSVILPINSKDAFTYVPYLNSTTVPQPLYASETNLWNGAGLSISFNSPNISSLGTSVVNNSTEIVSNPYSKKIKISTCLTAIVSSNVLTLTSATSLLTPGLLTGLIIGEHLKGKYTENTEILTLSETGSGPYTTIVTCKLPIDDTQYTTLLVATLFKYIININGWHSYKIVVKQAEQDYYNVYNMQGISVNPAYETTIWKSYLSLHGDNINKIPRMPMDVDRDTGITVSKEKIYSKVTISPSSGNPSIQQTITNKEAINILSVGSASEYALFSVTGGSTIWPSIYESTKNHLQAEIYDPSQEFGVGGTTSSIIPKLTVYETKPKVSNLDIYWETSTSGLVQDLNYEIQSQQTGGTGDNENQLETPPANVAFTTFDGLSYLTEFPESLSDEAYIPNLKVRFTIGNFNIQNIALYKLYDKNGSEITPTINYFDIIYDSVTSYYRVKLKTAYRYNGYDLTNQTFNFAIVITTVNPAIPTDIRTHYFGYNQANLGDALTLKLVNTAPSFVSVLSSNNFAYTTTGTGTLSSQTIGTTYNNAVNGSALTGSTTDDLTYSIISIERFIADSYAYGTNYTNGSQSYPNWNNYTGQPTFLAPSDPDWFDISAVIGTTTKGFNVSKSGNLIGLIPNARYKINIQALDCNGTNGALTGVKSIIYDHKEVKIVNQTWTTKNCSIMYFSDGSPIPHITNNTAWAAAATAGWCYYNNDPTTEAVYGKIYNWYAIMGIVVAESNPPTSQEILQRKTFAPSGWRVPAIEDFHVLNGSIGDLTGTNILDTEASGVAQRLKETGFAHWQPYSGVANGTNVAGFYAVPGGYRNWDTGIFGELGLGGFIWSVTPRITPSTPVTGPENVWSYDIVNFNNNTVLAPNGKMWAGYSVRLIRT